MDIDTSEYSNLSREFAEASGNVSGETIDCKLGVTWPRLNAHLSLVTRGGIMCIQIEKISLLH